MARVDGSSSTTWQTRRTARRGLFRDGQEGEQWAVRHAFDRQIVEPVASGKRRPVEQPAGARGVRRMSAPRRSRNRSPWRSSLIACSRYSRRRSGSGVTSAARRTAPAVGLDLGEREQLADPAVRYQTTPSGEAAPSSDRRRLFASRHPAVSRYARSPDVERPSRPLSRSRASRWPVFPVRNGALRKSSWSPSWAARSWPDRSPPVSPGSTDTFCPRSSCRAPGMCTRRRPPARAWPCLASRSSCGRGRGAGHGATAHRSAFFTSLSRRSWRSVRPSLCFALRIRGRWDGWCRPTRNHCDAPIRGSAGNSRRIAPGAPPWAGAASIDATDSGRGIGSAAPTSLSIRSGRPLCSPASRLCSARDSRGTRASPRGSVRPWGCRARTSPFTASPAIRRISDSRASCPVFGGPWPS